MRARMSTAPPTCWLSTKFTDGCAEPAGVKKKSPCFETAVLVPEQSQLPVQRFSLCSGQRESCVLTRSCAVLALALGRTIGRLQLGPFKFIAVIGVLLAGVTVSQIGIDAQLF